MKEIRVPLVRIDVNSGPQPRSSSASLSQGIHDAILAEYGIPERDYFHVADRASRGARSSPRTRGLASSGRRMW